MQQHQDLKLNHFKTDTRDVIQNGERRKIFEHTGEMPGQITYKRYIHRHL
jgi:hypothetical protein